MRCREASEFPLPNITCLTLSLFRPDLVTWRSYKGWFRPWLVGIGLSKRNPCDGGDRQFSFSPFSYRRFPNFDTGRFPEGGQGPFQFGRRCKRRVKGILNSSHFCFISFWLFVQWWIHYIMVMIISQYEDCKERFRSSLQCTHPCPR